MGQTFVTLPLPGSDERSLAEALLESLQAGVPSGDDLVVIVPALGISWQRVQLPPALLQRRVGWRGQNDDLLRAAIGGLLEDDLLETPADLHFALGAQPDADGWHWVAVCRKEWLLQCLQVFHTQGLSPRRWIPELRPAATGEAPTLTILEDRQDRWVAEANGHGVHAWPLSAGTLRAHPWPDDLALMAEPSMAGAAQELFGRAAILETRTERAERAARSDWDLAQFELAGASRQRWRRLVADGWRTLQSDTRWRPVRWLAALLILVQLVGLHAVAWQEGRLLRDKEQRLAGMLRTTFPQVQLVIEPELQMERGMQALRSKAGVSGPADFDAMLSAFSAATNATASRVDYDGQLLSVMGATLRPGTAASARQTLATQGYVLDESGESWTLRTEGAR